MSLPIKVSLLMLLCFNQISFAKSLEVSETVLPLKFNTGNASPYGLPSTVIEIEGKSLPIIVDTGDKNSALSLSEKALKNLHVKFTGKTICSKAFDGKNCNKEFIIPKIKLGNFVEKNVKGVLIPKLWGGNDDGFQATEASNNGVIGYPLLSKFNVLFDYAHSKLILVQPGKKPAQYNIEKWRIIPFNEHLLTKLKLNGKTVTLIWDTGAIPSKISRSIAKNYKQIPVPKNNPYNGGCNKCFMVETTSLTTMEDKILPNTWFSVIDIPSFAPFDGLIGSNFYAKNLVYFDFDNRRIYINPKS